MIKKKLIELKARVDKLLLSNAEKRHQLVGPPKLWKMKQDFQFKFLKDRGLQSSDLFLDIGCGTLRGGIPIINFLEKGNYYGIEVRKDVLAEGQKELAAHHLEHKEPKLLSFIHFDDLLLNVKFDIIFAFSVIIHLDDEIANSCFKFVKNHLSNNGRFFANVNTESQADGKWEEFPVVFRNLQFYEKLAYQNGLKLKIIGKLKDLGHLSGEKLADEQVMLEIRNNNSEYDSKEYK